jgi:hypothetical protein
MTAAEQQRYLSVCGEYREFRTLAKARIVDLQAVRDAVQKENVELRLLLGKCHCESCGEWLSSPLDGCDDDVHIPARMLEAGRWG